MSSIKERLDTLRKLIQEPEFLEGKGLSNEVNIRIFCYNAAEEMIVQHFIKQITNDSSLNCNLIDCNLYKIFLSICDDMDITEAIPDMEEADGGAYLLEHILPDSHVFHHSYNDCADHRSSGSFLYHQGGKLQDKGFPDNPYPYPVLGE